MSIFFEIIQQDLINWDLGLSAHMYLFIYPNELTNSSWEGDGGFLAVQR